MTTNKQYREWVLYFAELDRQGIPYSVSDMTRKANELDLPIPEKEKKKE